MNPAGPLSDITVYRVSPGTSKLTLPLGKTVTAIVERQLGNFRFQLKVGGSTLIVRSGVPFAVGDNVQLKVIASFPRLTLRLLGRGGGDSYASTVLGRLGIPVTEQSLAVVQAYLRTGESLRPDLLRRAVRLSKSDESRLGNPRSGRSVVEAEGRGMTPDDLWDYLFGPDLTGDGLGDRQYGDGRRHKDRTREKSPGLVSDVRRVLTRTTDAADHKLQLFNAVKGPGRLHWVIVPFQVESGMDRGEVTCRLGYRPDGGRVEEAVVEIATASRRYWFKWGVGPHGMIAGSIQFGIRSGTEKRGSIVTDENGILLARLRKKYHTVVKSFDHFDGFDVVETTNQYKEIDRYE